MRVHVTVHKYSTQYITDPIILPLILQTVITAQMLSTGGKGGPVPQVSCVDSEYYQATTGLQEAVCMAVHEVFGSL